MTMLLDSAREISTPEGAQLTLRLAGPVVRALAWLADFGIRAGIFIPCAIVLALLVKISGPLLGLLAFLLEWFYPILYEVFRDGATPGKRLLKIAVLKDDGTPIDWGSSFARNTLRAIDVLPIGYGVGLLTMLLGTGFHRLGDLAAGSVVVHRSEPPESIPIGPGESSIETRVPLTQQEQHALIDFVRRADSLTTERGEELATLAEPIVGDLPPSQARTRLLAVGRYLLGHSD